METTRQEESMIEDLRFIEREVDEGEGRGWTIKRILQYKINGQWQDVRMEKE